MGKIQPKKRNSSSAGSPYTKNLPSGSLKKNPIFKFNTDIGQHILKNPGIADAIVDKANIKEHEVVADMLSISCKTRIAQADNIAQVGPGTGVLTRRILAKAKSCTAIELDPRMAAELTKMVQGTPMQRKLKIILGDFIKVDLKEIGHFDVFISNTPYQISSPLVFKLLAMPRPPRVSILMVQREFAQRLIARPGDAMYSRLSVNAQFHAICSHILKVGKNNFSPPPQVESSVVRIEPRPDRPDISWEELDGMLRICFNRKNKTLRSSFFVKQVRELIERNWVTWASMFPDQVKKEDTDFLQGIGDIALPDVVMEIDGEDDNNNKDTQLDDEDDMMQDMQDMIFGTSTTAEKQKKDAPKLSGKTISVNGISVDRGRLVQLIQLKIQRALDKFGLSDKRSQKCDETSFLQLLHAFNQEGIRFS
ncbi:dimethyladenosine transferase [Talaromyces stipitatus ATCC 10500]|uniref:rRNA adenine N(6)-methyltransferase n=1 Tax=Talaromyces stipitatus (strain ATCC 10500 / CBS 375.48 / QM 6759 / NRRL 1006) TaxID=441959 RepID=B8M408_TALSN|nr:dimethyladenosine transferase [Talaromyces stipitatus ATCC 10500]EED20751.1 dimethyladenosine transferase [Talaromyces stipitatus ATCC 10500]